MQLHPLASLSTLSAVLLSCQASAQYDPAYERQQEPLIPERTILNSDNHSVKQVAIIGAGAAGSSAAYYLRQYASTASVPLNITIYDSNSYVGGRSTTVHLFDDPSQPTLELGASIFVKINEILYNATQDFGLSTDPFTAALSNDTDRTPDLGVFDGSNLILVQASNSYWDLAKLVWRYGLAPWRTLRLMRDTVGKFLTMYTAPIFPFADLTSTVEQIGLADTVAASGSVFLEQNSIALPFAHDVIQASTRVNYAANLDTLHGLETMVCMATEGAMSVAGGNWQIFAAMVNASGATRALGTKVGSVRRHWDGRAVVVAGPGNAWEEVYDEIVVAAPWQYTDIEWAEDVGLERVPDEIPYVELHVTLFTSRHRLDPTAFGMAKGEAVPRALLTTTPTGGGPEPDFLSISLLRDVLNPTSGELEFAYKIFTLREVDTAFLRRVLGLGGDQDHIDEDDVSWIHKKVWHSYPVEYPRVSFEPTQLAEDVWYTAGMDSFISTMETNSLMGMNVARLMVDKWLIAADQAV